MAPGKKNSLPTRFLKWRYKHISNKTFVQLLSLLIGLLSGLAAVTLKNLTYFIESFLDQGIVFFENQLYFVLPVIGLTLVYLYVKFVNKHPLGHAVSSILFALSKRRKGLLPLKKNICPLDHCAPDRWFWRFGRGCWGLRWNRVLP